MRINDRFNLTGVDIFTAGNDHVFHAVQNVEKPFGILIADVAGAKPDITKCERTVLGIIPVTSHDIGSPSGQFTSRSSFDLLSRLVSDLQIDARTRAAAG